MGHMAIYIESHLLCILLLVLILIPHMKYWRPRYLNSLCAIYLLTMLSSLLDIAWILVDGKPGLRWLNYAVNMVYLCSFEFLGFCWLNHCAKVFPFHVWKNRRQRFCYLLPALLISLVIMLSAFTGWVYGVDAAGVYYRGKWFFIQPMGYIYLFVTTGLSLRACKMAKYRSVKKEFLAMALFPLPSLFLGALQIIAPPGGLPAMQFSITFALLIQFITFLESSVTQDSLTGLSNRYALDRALNMKMNSRKNRADDLYVVLGDLDKFKSINDAYGHMEGDRALQITANTLKRIFHNSSAVLARMGGDEFAVILESESPADVQDIMAMIANELEKAGAGEAFNLSMSLGVARYAGQKTATEFLKTADHALYIEKQNRAVK